MSVSANGDGTDTVTLAGTAANIMTVSATPDILSADQNTPANFQATINTSFADTYNLTATAPPGWTVAIDSTGRVTVTPAAGLQAGTFPVQVVAQSATSPDLTAQTTVDVTVAATVPGITFAVDPDPNFTVPLDGAEVPSAFQAQIQNLGPAADTYNLSFANLPAGFTVLESGTSVTVPAGATGISGIYLQPDGQLPQPGTPISFDVTATSATDSSITQSVHVAFAMPSVDAVTVTATPAALNTIPGTGVTATLTLHNAGNVPETVRALDHAFRRLVGRQPRADVAGSRGNQDRDDHDHSHGRHATQ